jgi:hypothetical protein
MIVGADRCVTNLNGFGTAYCTGSRALSAPHGYQCIAAWVLWTGSMFDSINSSEERGKFRIFQTRGTRVSSILERSMDKKRLDCCCHQMWRMFVRAGLGKEKREGQTGNEMVFFNFFQFKLCC